MARYFSMDSPPDLASLLVSWQIALESERKAPGTRKNYRDGVTAFLRWCESTGATPELSKQTVQAFIAALLAGGAEAATAVSRQLALKRFSAWLADEGEIDADELQGMRPPKTDRKITSALTTDQVRALVKACQGKSFVHRRDEAIVRLMLETGMRAGEVAGLQMSDINVPRGLASVRRGKGGKGRVVPFGPQTAAAVDRYIRARRTHRLAGDGPLWVGGGGKTFGYHGLDRALKRRAQAAGIQGFHLHLLRHTFATRWKAARGSDDGLMAIAGWSSRDMIDRYAGAAAAERAAAEARGLGLGEL
jgi:site-specific recombinase XerD